MNTEINHVSNKYSEVHKALLFLCMITVLERD